MVQISICSHTGTFGRVEAPEGLSKSGRYFGKFLYINESSVFLLSPNMKI